MEQKIVQIIKKKLVEKRLNLSQQIHDQELELISIRNLDGISEDEEKAQKLEIEMNINSLLNRQRNELRKIDLALNKINNSSTYGECEGCGMDISEKRLVSNPSAIMCVDCQADQEKQ